MSSVFSIAASGMAAAQRRMEVSASNVANASNDDVAAAFAALRIDQVDVTGGGTGTKVRTDSGPAAHVDLAKEAVQQLVARYSFAANANVLRAEAKMQKALFDALA